MVYFTFLMISIGSIGFQSYVDTVRWFLCHSRMNMAWSSWLTMLRKGANVINFDRDELLMVIRIRNFYFFIVIEKQIIILWILI